MSMRRAVALAGIFIATAITLVLVIGVYMRYSVIVYGTTSYVDRTILALYSQEDLFLFIGHGRSILKARKAKAALDSITSTPQFPEVTERDLLVVHAKESGTSMFDLKGFGHSGSPFVYNGSIYWARGRLHGEQGPSRWKWHDCTFEQLSDSETSALNQQVQDFADATKGEGWSSFSIRIGGAKPGVDCPLRSGNIKIMTESIKTNSAERIRITLVRDRQLNSREIVMDVPIAYQQITKTNYAQLLFELSHQRTNY